MGSISPEKFPPIAFRWHGSKFCPPKNFRPEIRYGRIFLPRNFLGRIFSGLKIEKPEIFPAENPDGPDFLDQNPFCRKILGTHKFSWGWRPDSLCTSRGSRIMQPPLTPALPQKGAGAYACRILPVIPKRLLKANLRTGYTASSQPGDAQAAGAEPPRAFSSPKVTISLCNKPISPT